jgi:hypothetical protein
MDESGSGFFPMAGFDISVVFGTNSLQLVNIFVFIDQTGTVFSSVFGISARVCTSVIRIGQDTSPIPTNHYYNWQLVSLSRVINTSVGKPLESNLIYQV